jgi:LPXTG-site transpeptidase (sortase) family protein
MNLELTELLANEEEEVLDSIPSESEEGTEEENTEEEETKTDEVVSDYESYIGVLEVPKIGFSKGFYEKESYLNNVKFNLKILADSSYPDQDKGNVIIIGHSGNYNNSYFANLYQLDIGDVASINYMGSKYNYKIVDIYTDNKDGTVTIYRNENKSCLTLITCTKDDDTTQTIYIFELENI